MNYQQEVQPNLAIIGSAGLCEKYTEDVFGVSTARHDADAYDGWLNDPGQHPGETPPSNISVPLAFNWFGTIDGVYKNWGHRCVWVKGTIYTSPLSGTGHLTYPSISAIKSAFGLGNYLGWSECIENLIIVKGVTIMLTKEDIEVIYTLAFETNDVPQDIINAYVGKPLDGLLTQLHTDPTWLAHFNAVNNPPAPVINKQAVIDYLNQHLA